MNSIVSKINTCASLIKERAVGWKEEELAALALNVFLLEKQLSLNVTEVIQGLDFQVGFQALEFQLRNLVVEDVKGRLPENQIVIALLLHDFADFYNQQQLPIMKALLGDSRFKVITVLNTEPFPLSDFKVDPVFFESDTIYIKYLEEIEFLDFIDIFIALDFCSAKPIRFPKNSKRIVQPHGVDITFDYSVQFYGAGLLFDYVLSPSFADHLLANNYPTRYRGVFPKCLVDHASNEIRLIALGSTKLDKFIEAARFKPKKDIIYNISYWGLESALVHKNLNLIVSSILQRFPDRRLVFRAYPGEHALVEDYISQFRGNPNFYVSSGDCYIEDYSGGAVLLYHRGSSAEVFSLATGSPSVQFIDVASEEETKKTDLGYLVTSLDQMLDTLDLVLSEPDHRRMEIFQYREQIVPHAGRSMDYLKDCLMAIAHDLPLAEWKRIMICDHSETEDISEERIWASAEICERKGYLIPLLAAKAADSQPGNPILQLAAARAILTHIYPQPKVRDPGLVALRYLIKYYELGGGTLETSPLSRSLELWLTKEFPERFLGIIHFAFENFSAEELEVLRELIRKLPLGSLDPLGLPQKIRNCWL